MRVPVRCHSVVNLVDQTCDPNAVCVNAKCTCGTNYYGDGLTCQRTCDPRMQRAKKGASHGRAARCHWLPLAPRPPLIRRERALGGCACEPMRCPSHRVHGQRRAGLLL